jgi:hypothetical protein
VQRPAKSSQTLPLLTDCCTPVVRQVIEPDEAATLAAPALDRSQSWGRNDQVVDQADRQLTGGKPDGLVLVGVDHVVAATFARHLPGLATAHVVTDGLLQLQRDVFGQLANPGALVSRSTKPPRRPRLPVWFIRPGSRSTRASGKPSSLLVGKSSSTPRSTTSWMAGS